jgi:hypothetical protein
MATGLARWNLHRRLALNILARVGDSPVTLIAGFMGTTAFISMWISNTASTIMMIPIAISLANEVIKLMLRIHFLKSMSYDFLNSLQPDSSEHLRNISPITRRLLVLHREVCFAPWS